MSTPSNSQGQVQIKMGEKYLTVEEKDNKLMEPQFMEVRYIWTGLTGLTQGERGLASYNYWRVNMYVKNCILRFG